MQITTVGLDLAKNVFQVHGVDAVGKVGLRRQVRREQLRVFFANLPPGLIGMEACGGAHHWARKLQALGHEVRLIAPQFVKAYVKSNKTDAADAEAICEAVSREPVRIFVSEAYHDHQESACPDDASRPARRDPSLPSLVRLSLRSCSTRS